MTSNSRVVDLIVFKIIVFMVTVMFYNDVIKVLIMTILYPGYLYIAGVFAVLFSFLVYWFRYNGGFMGEGLSLERLLGFFLLLTDSVIVYLLASIFPEYYVTLGMISLILFVWSLLVFGGGFGNFFITASFVFALLLLVPLPTEALSYLITMGGLLTRIIGQRLHLSMDNGFADLVVFSTVSHILSIVALAPLAAALAYQRGSGLRGWLQGYFVSLAGGLLVILSSVFIKAFLVSYCSRIVCVIGYTSFLLLDVVFLVLEVIAAFVIVSKVTPGKSAPIGHASNSASIKLVMGGIIAVIAFAIITTLFMPVSGSWAYNYVKDVSEYLSLFSHSVVKEVSLIEVPLVGGTFIARFEIESASQLLNGVVVVYSINPVLHDVVEDYLGLKSYRTVDSWSTWLGCYRIVFTLMEGTDSVLLVGSVTYMLKSYYEEWKWIAPIFIKVMLIDVNPVNTLSSANEIVHIFNSTIAANVNCAKSITEPLSSMSIVLMILNFVTIIYLVLGYAFRLLASASGSA